MWVLVSMSMIVRVAMGVFMPMTVVVPVTVSMIVRMSVMVRAVESVELSEHPVGKEKNHDARDQIEVGSYFRSRPDHAAIGSGPREYPDNRGVRDGDGGGEQNGLKIGPARADDKGGHHALGVARLYAVKDAEKKSRHQKEPGMSAGLLGEVDWIHKRGE